MIGIKFPTTDKERWSTNALEIGIKTTFTTTKEVIDFFESGYNTFFITDKETFKGKKYQFKQGKDKDNYITQSDLADKYASVIGLDFDRHELVEGAATNTDKIQGLIDLSEEFGTVLYAPSKSSTDEIFSGRIFIFLNRRIKKEIFRKYLECWAHTKYGSTYIINHHKHNAFYFLSDNDIENTHISHEYIDRVAFNPSHKLNVYDGAKFELYHNGKRVWQTGDSEVPDIKIPSKNIANRLQKFGKADKLKLYNTYNPDNCIPIKDILHPKLKQEIIAIAANTARRHLEINGTPIKEGEPTSAIFQKYHREFREGEYPANGLLRRASDGAVKTASEWVADTTTLGNFAYEPNIRKEVGYLYIKNGRIFDYQGGTTTLVILKKKTIFEPIMNEIEGEYLPPDYYSKVLGKEKLAFCQAPTGSGKSHGCSHLKKTIFLVPTRALGDDLDRKEGFVYVRSSGDKNGDIKRIDDIPSQQSKDTIVMTYDKFAYIYEDQHLYDYNIIVDEAHLLFSQKFDKFTEARERLLWSMMKKAFRSVMLMSANPNFFEAYETFLEGEAPRVVIYTKPKQIKFIIKSDFSVEEVKRFKRERTIIYCNDKKLAASWAEMIDAAVISSENRIMQEIDENPSKNFVFTAVMREGYSFNSKVDNFIIDTRVNVITGANSVVQAASRARTGATNYYIRHSLGKVDRLEFKLNCVSVPLYYELASIFYSPKAYTSEERDVIKYLPLYAPVAKAVSAQAQKLHLSNLVALSTEAIENYERSDISLMMKNLAAIGYDSVVEDIGGEIARPLKRKENKEEVGRKLLIAGKAAYHQFETINGQLLTGNELKNKVLGLYNHAHRQKARGISVEASIAFLRKVDVTVIPLNMKKITMKKAELIAQTETLTRDEMKAYMDQNGIKRGRGKGVLYWVENIFNTFAEEEKRLHEADRNEHSSFPPPPTTPSLRERDISTTKHESENLIPPPLPSRYGT